MFLITHTSRKEYCVFRADFLARSSFSCLSQLIIYVSYSVGYDARDVEFPDSSPPMTIILGSESASDN